MKVELVRRDYVGNEGWETFLSYEDPAQDILVGLLRLRKLSNDTFRPELKGGCSMVRELHVYGSVVPVNSRDPTKFQHQVILLIKLVYSSNSYCLFKSVYITWNVFANLTFSPLHPSQRRVLRSRPRTTPFAATGYAVPKRSLLCESTIVQTNYILKSVNILHDMNRLVSKN